MRTNEGAQQLLKFTTKPLCVSQTRCGMPLSSTEYGSVAAIHQAIYVAPNTYL